MCRVARVREWLLVLAASGLAACGVLSGSNVPGDLPRCEPVKGDETLDIEAGCWRDLCIGYPEVDWLTDLGPCDDSRDVGGSRYCDYDDGIEITVDTATGLVRRIEVYERLGASTPDGVGPGATLSCYVRALGDPSELVYVLIEDEYLVERAEWMYPPVIVYDAENSTGQEVSDGVFEKLEIND